jgi:hypothetical protein
MNHQQLEIEEDSQSDKLLDLQNNKSAQEQMAWQHLTLQKLNEMNHIPDKNVSDLDDD